MSRFDRCFAWLLVAALLLSAFCCWPLWAAERNDPDADAAIQAGRRALSDSWSSPPWYDAESDTVRRVDVKPTASWSLPNWRMPLPNLSFMEWVMWVVVAIVLAVIVYLLIRAYLNRESFNTHLQREKIRLIDDIDGDAFRGGMFPHPLICSFGICSTHDKAYSLEIRVAVSTFCTFNAFNAHQTPAE